MEMILEKIKDNQLIAGLGAGIIILTSLVCFLLLKPDEQAPAFPVVAEVTQEKINENEASSAAFSTASEKFSSMSRGL